MKFKIGDKVKNWIFGNGIIVEYDIRDNTYCVKFREGKGWFVETDLKLIKRNKPKVYAWDRSAKREQYKLEETQENIGCLIYMFNNWEYLWNRKINSGAFQTFANYLLKRYNVILEN